MKPPFSSSKVQRRVAATGFGRNRPERGVALVITLLLLAVITFMAVTFLVVARNEHGNVATDTDMSTARYAADAALVRAEVELAAAIMGGNNPFNYGLMVSTNYVNASGFFPGVSSPTNVNYNHTSTGLPLTQVQFLQNLTNLLYNASPPVYVVTNALATHSNEFRFYIDMNRNGRYDPNGLQPVISPDPNKPYYNINGGTMPTPVAGQTVSNFMTGDPEWIGILQVPQSGHSANNQFVSRYAYMVVPAGQTLDVNTMHNDTKFPNGLNGMGRSDGFLRDQGVLTAELSLGGFLADLNTNLWPVAPSSINRYGFTAYNYVPIYSNMVASSYPNQGAAFDDALGLLAYRYFNKVKTLPSVPALFSTAGTIAFSAPIDLYSQGPVMDGTGWPPQGFSGNPNLKSINNKDPWQGAANPNQFYSPQDFFDENKTASNIQPPKNRASAYTLTKRLQMAATNVDTYNSSTFYRLLSQLGTDSTPDPGGKMNLNYVNVNKYKRVVPGMVTNFQSWIPTNFFENAVVRLLADAGYSVGNVNGATNLLVTNLLDNILVTNLHIPIWPTNYYTPSVHRLLQLAANLYDSTTNRLDYGNQFYPFAPTVFRPWFDDKQAAKGGRQVFITGYSEVLDIGGVDKDLLATNPAPHDLSNPGDLAIRPGVRASVYGVPLIVGAKKGLPNFNQYAGQTVIEVTRKLLFSRPVGTTLPVNQTNQIFLVGITNYFGVQAWNSYVSNWNAYASGRNLQLVVLPDVSAAVSNRNAPFNTFVGRYNTTAATVPFSNWQGYNPAQNPPSSFIVPLSNSVSFLPASAFVDATHTFVTLPPNGSVAFEKNPPDGIFYVPQWQLNVNTHVRFAVVDVSVSPNRLLDYVNLSDVINTNLTGLLAVEGQCGNPYTPDASKGSMWCTNRLPNANPATDPTIGVWNQIDLTMGDPAVINSADWNFIKLDVGGTKKDKFAQIDFFRFQFDLFALYGSTGLYKTNSFSALSPSRVIYVANNWQANDPLVHYTVGDMVDLVSTNGVTADYPPSDPNVNLKSLSTRYEPWGKTRGSSKTPSVGAWEIGAKDPVPAVKGGSSDYWDFSTNKYPHPGWMGRVHRGTPWQTVYFKAPVRTDPSTGLAVGMGTTNTLKLQSWMTWTGNGASAYNFGQYSTDIIPLYNGSNSPILLDAYLTQPTNDWRLLDLFSTAFSDTATKGQLSVNQPGLAAWSAVLSGVIALTNSFDLNKNAVLAPWVIQPGGVYDPNDTNTWTPLVRIVNALNLARTNSPGHVFTHMGDILTVPELTVGSPFLNTSARLDLMGKADYVLNDAAYERIPQQILGLLKVDPAPRFVIYSYGQALKPAPRSAFTGSGPFFGVITNYQIMAEVATRAVVRFDGAPTYLNGKPSAITNLHPVIESFTVLRPD